MDLDRYLATHRPTWERLAQLSTGGRRSIRRFDDEQLAELVQLYQRTSSHLSYVRTYYRDPALTAHLTRLVSTAGATIYGTRPRTWRAAGRFFTTTFPAALFRARRFVAVAAALLLVPALVTGTWIATSERAADAVFPPAVREAYLQEDFEDYYASEQASEFSSSVFTNNVQVSVFAFAGGVLLCIPTVLLLIANGANLGFAGGLFHFAGEAGKFWGLITPHGLLEMTAIIIAGGAGLQLGWAVVKPGERTRSQALSEEAQRAVVVLLGLILAFAAAGFIEGYVTGQPWPTWLRVGIGATVEAAFLVYVIVQGRRAAAKGYTGALGEGDELGWARRAA